jgi:hypothetical protein
MGAIDAAQVALLLEFQQKLTQGQAESEVEMDLSRGLEVGAEVIVQVRGIFQTTSLAGPRPRRFRLPKSARVRELLARIGIPEQEVGEVLVNISGYAVGTEGMSLKRYSEMLCDALARVQLAAEATNRRYQIGIPATSSWGEYEFIAGAPHQRATGLKQKQYIYAVLDAIAPYRAKPQYLGLALWHLTDPARECTRPEDATTSTKFPTVIQPEIWCIRERSR